MRADDGPPDAAVAHGPLTRVRHGEAAAARERRERLAAWWRAARPYSLTASATPVLVGTSAAVRDGRVDPLVFLATLAGAVAIQAGANMVNDYYDYARGIDVAETTGHGGGVIQHGLLAPRAVFAGGMALFGVGGTVGLWLAAIAGWPILVAGVLSVLAGYAYTGGPFPFGYVGLGDLVVFVFMGPVIVLGAYFVQLHALGAAAWWASAPVASLVTAILVVNNVRDLDRDRERGKRTFAALVGRRGAHLEYAALLAAAYVSIAAGIAVRALPPIAAATLLTAPAAIGLVRTMYVETDPARLSRLLRDTARLHARTGLLLALALLASAIR